MGLPSLPMNGCGGPPPSSLHGDPSPLPPSLSLPLVPPLPPPPPRPVPRRLFAPAPSQTPPAPSRGVLNVIEMCRPRAFTRPRAHRERPLTHIRAPYPTTPRALAPGGMHPPTPPHPPHPTTPVFHASSPRPRASPCALGRGLFSPHAQSLRPCQAGGTASLAGARSDARPVSWWRRRR